MSLKDAADVTESIRSLNSTTTSQHISTLRDYAINRPGDDAGAAAILEELATSLKEHEFKTPAKRAVARFRDRFATWAADLAGRAHAPESAHFTPASSADPTPGPAPAPASRTHRSFELTKTSDLRTAEQSIAQEISELISEGHSVRVIIESLED